MQFSVHITLWQFHWNNIKAGTCCSFIIHTIGGEVFVFETWFVILQVPEVSDQEVPEEEQSSWLAARCRQHQGELRAPLLPDQSGWRGGGRWRLNWHFVGLNKFCLQYKTLSVFSEVFSRQNPGQVWYLVNPACGVEGAAGLLRNDCCVEVFHFI